MRGGDNTERAKVTGTRGRGQPLCDPIGVFDSGIGGLTVLREIVRQSPERDTLYLADSAHCPYGQRSQAEIRSLSEGVARYLLDRGACCVVVACNTASAAALAYLRARFPGVPFVGMVPAVKPAVAMTRSGTVGVLATPMTLQGQLLSDVIERFAGGVRVLTQGCPGLVERVEAGDLESPDTEALVRRYLEPLLEQGADAIVLGCTHYPFLAPLIQRLAGPGVQLVDPSAAVARQVGRVLEGRANTGHGQHVFFTTGAPQGLAWAVRHLLEMEAEVEQVTVEMRTNRAD